MCFHKLQTLSHPITCHSWIFLLAGGGNLTKYKVVGWAHCRSVPVSYNSGPHTQFTCILTRPYAMSPGTSPCYTLSRMLDDMFLGQKQLSFLALTDHSLYIRLTCSLVMSPRDPLCSLSHSRFPWIHVIYPFLSANYGLWM